METDSSNIPKSTESETTFDSGEDSVPLRALAQFVFVREEHDGEVRLLFRDVSAPEIASVFRTAGARLISIAGEHALPTEDKEPAPSNSQHSSTRHPTPGTLDHGAFTLRYFFDLNKTVYTVSVTSSAAMASSVSGIYPPASPLENELCERLGIVFTS